MLTIDQIQQYAMTRWGELAAATIAVVFMLLVFLQIYDGIAFALTTTKSINHTPIIPPQTAPIDLSKMHIFGLYQPKNINPKQLPESTLSLQLEGVFATVPEKLSQAVLSVPGGKQKIYYEGDELPENAKLYRILDNSVIIQYDGQLQRLLLPKVTHSNN